MIPLDDIQLDERQKQRIASLAEQQSRDWSEVLKEALDKFFQSSSGSESITAPKGRRAGSARGKIEMASDFDAPLEDFKDYM